MSNPSDICIVTGIFPPESGGPSKFAESFLSWGERTGRRISVISLTNDYDEFRKLGDNSVILISRNRIFLSRFYKSVVAIRKMMRSGVPILANGMFLEVLVASYFTFKSGKYVVKIPGDIVWERSRNNGQTNLSIDDYQDSKLSFKYALFRKLFSKSICRADSVIVPSTHLKNLAMLWGASNSKIELVFNSIDLNRFAFRENLNSQYDVLTVCRLVPWKGLDELVDACAKLNLTLAVVGDGPERSHLEKLSIKTGAQVTFFGEIPQARLPEILKLASSFVLNSNFEATSYALIEARSVGLFSIARRNTGSEEVITHNYDGLLCGKEGPTLKEALAIFKNDRPFTLQALERARLDCEVRFNESKNFQKIFEIVQASIRK